jgi:hypothetical protein
MTTRLRLFTRDREFNIDFKKLSSSMLIIVLHDTFSDDIHLRQRLHHLPNWHYFQKDTINNCIDLIKQDAAKDTLILLIISNQFVDFVRHNLLESVSQRSHVYLFDDILHKEDLLSDRRFHGTFSNVQLLLERMRSDVKETVKHTSHTNSVIQYILEDNAKFSWYWFTFKVLDCLQHTNIAKYEIIPPIRAIPEENSRDCRDIVEFEREYESGKVIWWYTRESFFYRQLNGALRSHDINEIFSWRVYIQDLDRNLRKLCLKQVESKKIYLFRGRKLHINEIYKQRDNLGKLIIITCFLSATSNRDFAELFAGDSVSADSPFQPVLYRILIDASTTKVLGADVRHLSMYPNEEEFIFSLRSMFRIERVEFIDNRWQIDLTAIDENDLEFCMAINPWKIIVGEQCFFSGRDQPLFTRYLNIENGPFLAFQLLIDLMLRLDQTKFARQEMIEMCRVKYADSPTDLKKIDDFEQKYRHEDAIKWYTSGSFLYRLLHGSLRLENIDAIFKLRYYIYDLHNQLAQLQITYLESLPANKPNLTLYRGQHMKIIELEILRKNVGKLISMNSFLSTTSDIEAAVFFSGHDTLDDPETEVSVIYQITIDTRVPHSVPFAKIDYLSVYEHEDEVLFSMASVFRIDVVEKYGTLWVVDLTLINKEDEEWNVLTAHLNS